MLSVDETSVAIPTYVRGPDDPHVPLTFSGRRRGRSRPYPYRMQDDIDIATMGFDAVRRYRALVLRNDFLEVTVLPDMNGRVYSVRDVRSRRELFYRNNVIKPALVALRGAWLSGGIEFNFPTRGHSVSTVSPVFSRVERSDDCVAVLIGDIDRSTRQLWEARIALRRGRAAVDISCRFINPNLVRERLYHWQNAAVPARDDLRFVCRCDWTVGSESLAFPVRDGVDVSRHVNNPRPCDHFGYRSYRDFFGAYYSGTRSGTYHVAPRWLAPGQKYFTWGTEADNRIWEDYLTDDDGQYVEIQAGLLESQYVTGWLEPLESVRTAGSWFGVEGMAELTWGNERVAAALNLDGPEPVLEVLSLDVDGMCNATVRGAKGATDHAVRLQPGEVTSFPLGSAGPCTVSLRTGAGELLLYESWAGGDDPRALAPDRPTDAPVQWAMGARARPAWRRVEEHVKYHAWGPARDALASVDQAGEAHVASLLRAEIALKTGACRDAYDAAVAAAAVDPGGTTAHSLAAGAALALFRLEGEPRWYYAVWDHAIVARRDGRYRAAALCALSQAEVLRGRLRSALATLEEVARLCPDVPDVGVLLSGVRRRCGLSASGSGAEAALFPHGWCEAVLSGQTVSLGGNSYSAEEVGRMGALLLEALLVYWRVGWYDELAALMDWAESVFFSIAESPVWAALRSDVLAAAEDVPGADEAAQRAAAASVDGVVPGRWEEAELLLRAAVRIEDEVDTHGLAYLRGVWQAENGRVDDAVAAFQQGRESSRSDVRILSDKALADWYELVEGNREAAVQCLRDLLALCPGDRRALLQLDDCLHALHDVAERAALWQDTAAGMAARGDITFRIARCAFDCGRPEEAVQLLLGKRFSVYEGGTSVRRLYVDALLAAAMLHWREGRAEKARQRCRDVFDYPPNLGAASYLGEHSRLARFLLGFFAEREGDADAARTWWEDVLARSRGDVAYVVGDVDAAARLRADERMAVVLASQRLGQAVSQRLSVHAAPDTPAGAIEALCAALLEDPRSAGSMGRDALGRFPCDPVLRLLAGLADTLADAR